MRYFIALLSLLLPFSQFAQPQKQVWKFLSPGDFPADEAPAHPGNGWLGLTVVDATWHLEPTTVKSTPIPHWNGASDSQKGFRITPSAKDYLAFFRLPELKPGKVDTPNMRFRGEQWILYTDPGAKKNDSIEISFKGESYSLEASKPSNSHPGQLYLVKGNQRTLLPDVTTSECVAAQLIWAGDLDGDGQLDLIIEGEGDEGLCLFLSGGTHPGKLVRKAACHTFLNDC